MKTVCPWFYKVKDLNWCISLSVFSVVLALGKNCSPILRTLLYCTVKLQYVTLVYIKFIISRPVLKNRAFTNSLWVVAGQTRKLEYVTLVYIQFIISRPVLKKQIVHKFIVGCSGTNTKIRICNFSLHSIHYFTSRFKKAKRSQIHCGL